MAMPNVQFYCGHHDEPLRTDGECQACEDLYEASMTDEVVELAGFTWRTMAKDFKPFVDAEGRQWCCAAHRAGHAEGCRNQKLRCEEP